MVADKSKEAIDYREMRGFSDFWWKAAGEVFLSSTRDDKVPTEKAWPRPDKGQGHDRTVAGNYNAYGLQLSRLTVTGT